jgi:hypothetical protein
MSASSNVPRVATPTSPTASGSNPTSPTVTTPGGHTRSSSFFSKLQRTLSTVTGKKSPEEEEEETAGELSSVEKQTEVSRQSGTIWDIVRKGDMRALAALLAKEPGRVDERGFAGEQPLHMCFLYASEQHLDLAKYIISQFPKSITSIYTKTVTMRRPTHCLL